MIFLFYHNHNQHQPSVINCLILSEPQLSFTDIVERNTFLQCEKVPTEEENNEKRSRDEEDRKDEPVVVHEERR